MKLSPLQQRACDHLDGPALVLSVPGSGKTTVLLARIRALVAKGVPEKSILTVTFSRSQAIDMSKRYGGRDASFFTIHSFCYRLVQGYLKYKKRSLRLIEDYNSFHKTHLVKRLHRTRYKKAMGNDEVEEFFRIYGYIKNTEDESYTGIPPFIRTLIEDYEKAKCTHHYIDFDDMLTMAKEILLAEPEWLEKTRRRFPYIQLDEGQDTSKVQMEILRLIAQPRNNLFIVADDDQSIYGFRGADPTALLEFKTWYPDASLYYLKDNFRSAPTILRHAKQVIGNNQIRYQKEMDATIDEDAPIRWKRVANRQKQLEFLMKEIKKRPNESVAVLYRNHLSGLPLAIRLQANGIPYQSKGRWRELLTHPFTMDFIAFLRLAENPADTDAFLQIYYKLGAYICKEQAVMATNLGYTDSVWDALLENDELPDWRKSNLYALRKNAKRLTKMSFSKRIPFILQDMDYTAYVEEHKRRQTLPQSSDAIIDTLTLVAEKSRSLEDFIHQLESPESSEEANLVLSTIHASKGLEYDHVYLIDCIQEEIPGKIDKTEEGKMQMEEERRLFYVAMTRAKKTLTLITPHDRNRKSVDPSQFIDEMQGKKIGN